MPTPPPSNKRKRRHQRPEEHLAPTHVKAQKCTVGDCPTPSVPDSPIPTTVTSHMQKLDLKDNFRCWEPRSNIRTSTFDPDIHLPMQSLDDPLPPSLNDGTSTRTTMKPSVKSRQEIQEITTIQPTSPMLVETDGLAKSNFQALWWSEGEITGHGLDPCDPTDDGEGINGIGFIPTPAIAYARAAKRRRQVKDWKEREAREARVKRGQRRYQDSINAVTSEDQVSLQVTERRVRFFEV